MPFVSNSSFARLTFDKGYSGEYLTGTGKYKSLVKVITSLSRSL